MISEEVMNAHLSGYKMSTNKNSSSRAGGLLMSIGHGPRVREPPTGLHHDQKMDRELYMKRQAAGGGIPSNSIQSQEKNWEMAVSTLFCL